MIEERNGVRNWASILDEGTRLQAEKLAQLRTPFRSSIMVCLLALRLIIS